MGATRSAPFGWPSISPARDMSLLGLPGFYAPRPDVWNFPRWTSIYDTKRVESRRWASTSASSASTTARRDLSFRQSTSCAATLKRFRNAAGSREAPSSGWKRATWSCRSPPSTSWRAGASRRSFRGPGSARSSTGTAALSTTRRWATRWRPFPEDDRGLSAAGRDEFLSADRQGAEESARRRGSRARIELRQPRAAGPRIRAADQQAAAARRGPRKGSRDRICDEELRRQSIAARRYKIAKTVEIDLQTPGEGQAGIDDEAGLRDFSPPRSMIAAERGCDQAKVELATALADDRKKFVPRQPVRWLRRSAEICDKAPARMSG